MGAGYPLLCCNGILNWITAMRFETFLVPLKKFMKSGAIKNPRPYLKCGAVSGSNGMVIMSPSSDLVYISSHLVSWKQQILILYFFMSPSKISL